MTEPVVRRWEARATRGAIDRWLEQFHARVMPKYRGAEGFRGVQILVSRGEEPHDVVVLTEWDDMDAVKRFSGPTPERAVMPDWVVDLIPDHDTRAAHYDKVLMEHGR